MSYRKIHSQKNQEEANEREKASEAYEEYLLLLQQRNRILKKLKEKDEKQLDLEKREQGFSLYLNGANVGLHLSGNHRPRKTKTAGESTRQTPNKDDVEFRAQTAPNKQTRRGWNESPPDKIKIKTKEGTKLTVDLPESVSGKYEEDFEVYQSFLATKLEEEEFNDDDEEDEGRSSGSQREESDGDSDGENDGEGGEGLDQQLTFTVEDLKTLRASLEMDSSIRKSIAEVEEDMSSSDSEDDDEDEDIDKHTDRNNQTGIELEEIEEEVEENGLDVSQMIPLKDISEELIEPELSDHESDHKSDSVKEEIVEEIGELGKTDAQKSKDVEFPFEVERSSSPTFDLGKHKECIELSGAAPKSRPVTASRKKLEDSFSVASSVMSDDLASAIEEENRRLSEYKGKRELKSAPVTKGRTLPSEFIEERPQTIQGTLSNDDITSITERVRKMSGRQQRKLLKMLAELEEAEQTKKEIQDLNITEDEKDKFLREQKNKRKLCTLPVAFGESSQTQQADEIENSFLTRHSMEIPVNTNERISDTKQVSDSAFEIRFEFRTNWGNPDYIGLTEIQLIKENHHRVRLYSKDIKVTSAHAQSSLDDIKNIINHKTKTTKDKYMWKANHTEGKCLKLSMNVSKIVPDDIQKIVIWNYNKNLQDLNIGVKDCEIFINDKSIWNGVIDKGCGNQIFDFSKVIQLKENASYVTQQVYDNTLSTQDSGIKSSVSPSLDSNTARLSLGIDSALIARPSTRTIDCSGDNTRQLPVVDIVTEDNNSTTKSWQSPREEPLSPRHKKLSTGSKPMWLTESTKVKQQSTEADDYIDDSLRPRSRPSSGRRSQLQQHNKQATNSDDLFEETIKPSRSRPSSGRRSQLSDRQLSPSPDLQRDRGDKDELDVLFDLNTRPRRTRGAVSTMDSVDSQRSLQYDRPTLTDAPHGKEGKSERQLFKEMMDANWEQSLRSIDNFNTHHLGRIEANLDDDETVGSYLEQMKPEDHQKLLRENEEVDASVENALDENEDMVDEDSPRFEIPLLPKGKELIINIKSTWGDKHYVGLNGIEVFTDSGQLAPIKNIQANPADINILPEYEGDPRVVKNLMDGCFLTRDDLHLWLTPYTSGGDHLVAMEFEEEFSVSMIRIWNYNKSRIHSSRGARFVELALDGKLIFIGEIARASGVLSAEDPYGDTILFTTDEEILELVAEHDQMYEVDADDDEDQLAASFDIGKRPATGNEEDDDKFRPFTAPKSRENSREGGKRSENNPPSSDSNTELKMKKSISIDKEEDEVGFFECTDLCIFFTGTWGDMHYLGLTGLEVLGETFEPIPLNLDMLDAMPRDLNDLEDYDDDDRTLDKLINGVNVTMSDENMWMIPFDDEGSHVLKISFEEPTVVTGLRVWNYNKSLEDTFRGAKVIHVYMDERDVSPENGFLLRKGPGHCHFDFAQDILLNHLNGEEDNDQNAGRERKVNLRKIVDEYETVVMPCGFVFQLRLLSSWGDQYYVGLNGIEVFDQHGNIIPLTDNNITAFPHSCNILDGVKDDARTPDKLVDGVNDTYDGRHMWLSPIFPGQVNLVYLVFDQPVTVSMIKIWNYSKTPSRGVRQFGLLVDDLLVYSGALPQPALFSRGIIPGVQVPVHHHTILFTDSEEIAIKEKGHLLSSSISMEEQAVTLTNDRSVLKSHKDKYAKGTPNQAMRPMTSVTSRK